MGDITRLGWSGRDTFGRRRDVDGDTLTFSLVRAPNGASINAGTGALSWTPTSAQIGTVMFKVRVTDNGTPNLFAEQNVNVTVGKRATALVYTGASSGFAWIRG